MENAVFVQEIVDTIAKTEAILKPDILKERLYRLFENKEIREISGEDKPKTNEKALELFLSAKQVEGCSIRSVRYYRGTLLNMFCHIKKPYMMILTDDIRGYLSSFQDGEKVSKTTIDNVRRIISTFFSWLEAEDYILKSPSRRIHKVKTGKFVKETFNDETLEKIRQTCRCIRDLAIVDFLYSTGVRVGELVKLNIQDVDFENRECVVLGKGNKQRRVYFDAKTKIEVQEYLQSRQDDDPSLFASRLSPHRRLNISGVEILLRKIGSVLGITKVHPHKFRRTLATKAIDKGMPIEQVQHLLGHTKIDTTLEYAMVDDTNVKLSHKKYLE
jgi:Site-specific recombinase XerD